MSSYAVQDRVQVADIDPSMVVASEDGDDYSDSHPCPVCGDDDNEDVLILCDGCDVATHTYCLGLDSVPSGPWFCHNCEAHRAISEPAHRSSRPGRRTRGDQRRHRNRTQVNAMHWAYVWQSVLGHINIDWDFPFDDEEAADRLIRQQRREAANQREFQAWERRFQVAQRHGAANRFRDTVPALLDIGRGWPSRPRPRLATPEPESLDEVRAWNAFERARELDDKPPLNRRKRMSPTASPAEPEPAQPERKLKRPRTRRPEALADLLESRGESSRVGKTPVDNNASTPSFLQSLLKEVEDSSTPNFSNGGYRPPASTTTPTGPTSPRPSSPAQSSLPSSNRSSPQPCSTTPPPLNNGPVTPASSPSDAGNSSPEFSPEFSPTYSPNQNTETPRQPRPSRPKHRVSTNHDTSSPCRARSNETSPTRAGLSLSTKSDLQEMVRGALRPHYRSRRVNKDEYTDINRRISRMLYERVGDVSVLDAESKSKWNEIANEEVGKVIASLKEPKSMEASDSSGGISA